MAAAAGYRCFTHLQGFRSHIAAEINPAVGAEA